ncbi:MAG TPA: glycosyltransferase family 4 protein [Bryobacteraceae bacterium]|nr:glycosyltransferase family 4 protein [Bryobacteraceae bacterium]
MRIAVFDYRVIRNNPVGSCHLKMLDGLCHQHEFTVFAVEFENPCPERIRWVRIPVPVRPYILLYALYHLAAPLAYFWARTIRGMRFDLVQLVESNLLLGQVSYSHFCHRRYLKRHWSETRAAGLRGWLRGLAHWAAARMEPLVYRRVRHVVVPSRGLAEELRGEYPASRQKILLLPNSVDVDRLRPPSWEQRQELRESIGIASEDTVLVFVALGHFERKGLPLLLEAAARLSDPHLKVFVIGGEKGLLEDYRQRIGKMGLGSSVRFEGMQRDLRPYYWSADAFLLPSCYEVFPLVALEAAAAGLPLLVTPLNGVEEMLADGRNGFLMERSVEGVFTAIRNLMQLTKDQRQAMGAQARETALRYDTGNFVAAWKNFYASLA